MLNLLYKLGNFIKYRYSFIFAFIFAFLFEIDIYSFVFLLKCISFNYLVGIAVMKLAIVFGNKVKCNAVCYNILN